MEGKKHKVNQKGLLAEKNAHLKKGGARKIGCRKCSQIWRKTARALKKHHPQVEKAYDEDGPFWARELKALFISEIAKAFPKSYVSCACPLSQTVNTVVDLLLQSRCFSKDGNGSMEERATVDNMYAYIKSLILEDRETALLIETFTRLTSDGVRPGITGLVSPPGVMRVQ